MPLRVLARWVRHDPANTEATAEGDAATSGSGDAAEAAERVANLPNQNRRRHPKQDSVEAVGRGW